MDHAEAIASNAAERYVLGELSPLESEDFERHFFVCLQCSEDMQAHAAFIENARAVFVGKNLRSASATVKATPERGGGWARWFRPALVPALAGALACVVVYQNAVTIPSLQRTSGDVRPLPSFPLLAASRGEDPQIGIPRGAPFYSLYLDAPGDGAPQGYNCVLLDESGNEKWSVTAPVPPPGRPLTLLVPADATPPGRYKLIVRSGAAETAEYRFRFDYK